MDPAGYVSCVNLFTETDPSFEWCVSLTTTETMKKVRDIYSDSKLFSGISVACNFQTGNNTAWTSYMPRKARVLKLFSILQYWFYS
jgi:hypothetical protein